MTSPIITAQRSTMLLQANRLLQEHVELYTHDTTPLYLGYHCQTLDDFKSLRGLLCPIADVSVGKIDMQDYLWALFHKAPTYMQFSLKGIICPMPNPLAVEDTPTGFRTLILYQRGLKIPREIRVSDIFSIRYQGSSKLPEFLESRAAA